MKHVSYREKSIGKNVRFLLPSLKLKGESASGGTVEQGVHAFLLKHFGGYTATAANVFGYWKNEAGENSYGEHREFTVGLISDDLLDDLKSFLSRTAREMDEECLYLEVAGVAMLIYAA